MQNAEFTLSTEKGLYNEFRNLTIIEMLYYGYFGVTDVLLTENQFKRILMEGNVNVSNVIIN